MRLPDYKFVQGGNTRVNMSPQAASAAGRGFARMSEDLAGVGMQVAGLFENAEEVHDQGKMIELQTEMDQMYASYNEEMMRTPNDALKWREGWDNLTNAKQMELDKRDMSGNLRQRVDMFTSKYFGQKGINVSHNAMRTEIENTRGVARARIDHLGEMERYDEAREMNQMAYEGNILPEREWKERDLGLERQQNYQQVQNEMLDSPLKFIGDAESGKFDGLVNPTNLNKLVIDAKKTISNKSIDSFNLLKNKTDAAGFDNVKQLEDDEDFAKLTPSNKKAAREYYYDSTDEQQSLHYKNPENFNELYGDLDLLLYNANRGEIPDAASIGNISAKMKYVTDPAKKSEYEERLEKLITGKEEAVKTIQDDVDRQVEADYARKEKSLIKPETQEFTRDDFIEREGGFFTEENLKGFGIKEKYRKAILNKAEIDIGGKAVDIRGLDSLESNKLRAKLLAEVWDSGEQGRDMANDAKLNEFQRKFIRSIHRGSGKDILSRYDDPIAGKKHDDKVLKIKRDLGNEKVKMRNFLRNNPKATQTEINKFRGAEKVFKRSTGAGLLIDPAPVQYPSGASTDVNENPWGKLGGDLLEFESDKELAELLQQGKEAQLAVDMKDEEKKRVASNSKK